MRRESDTDVNVRPNKYRFLTESHPDVSSSEVPVDGVFQVIPPIFEPLADEPPLADGEPPTKVGKAVMASYARAFGFGDPYETPTGVVRAIEMIAVPSDANVLALNSAGWRRNAAGLAFTAVITVFTPLVRPATVNPRFASAAQRVLRVSFGGNSLVHRISDGLTIKARDTAQLLDITAAQQDRSVLDPADYTGTDRKDFVDDLAMQGIREPIRGFVFRYLTDDGEGHGAETNDGYTRIATAQAIVSNLCGVDANLSTLHWENGDGTFTVRDASPDDIRRAWAEMLFDGGTFEVWPTPSNQQIRDEQVLDGEPVETPAYTSAGIRSWLTGASRAQHAVLRLLTCQMEIGLGAHPHSAYSDHDVVYADMSRFHQKRQKPSEWKSTEHTAFIGRVIFTELADHGYLTDAEVAVTLGETIVPCKDDPSRTPYRNRVVALAATMIAGVIDDPAESARYRTVLDTLARNGLPRSPLQAATLAANLAGGVGDLEGNGGLGQFTAAVARSFKKPNICKIGTHAGNWADQIGRDLDSILTDAQAEFESVKDTAEATTALGPNQRALALLAFLAHASNNALYDYTDTDGNRLPSTMTITGRGGRDGVRKVDADVIMFHAARSTIGIEELAVVVRATIDHNTPVVPVDPAGGEDMTESWLRLRWQKTPNSDGTPNVTAGPTGAGGDGAADGGETGEDDVIDTDVIFDEEIWHGEITQTLDELEFVFGRLETLADVPASAELLAVDDESWDADDENLPRLIDCWGINRGEVNAAQVKLEEIRALLMRGMNGAFERNLRQNPAGTSR